MLMHLPHLVAAFNDSCGYPICAGTSHIPKSTTSISDGLKNATATALVLLGALAVIFVIVGGFQYVISGGNPSRTKQARETIIYAMVGVVLAGSAYAIITFVFGRL